MKVLLITYCLGGSASGKITFRMAEELASRGHELYIIAAENHIMGDSHLKTHVIRGTLLNNHIFNLLRVKVLSWLGFSAYNSHYIWRIRVIHHIKTLLLNWHPDWIYCRSTPIDACMIGAYLHKFYSISTIQHFSDPLPAPSCSSVRLRNRFLRQTQTIINESELVSFSTEEMASYIKSLLGEGIKKQIYILPDVTDSNPICFQETHYYNNPAILAYMGSIYGTRNPIPLFQGIEILNNTGISCILKVYSSPPKNASIPSFVHYMGYTSEVKNALQSADILIDLDGDDLIPVFVSSKLKDYLTVSRPILSITPKNSPAYKLVKHLPTVRTTTNEKCKIASAIKSILQTEFSEEDYKERFLLAQQFTPKAVTDKLLSIIDTIPTVHE